MNATMKISTADLAARPFDQVEAALLLDQESIGGRVPVMVDTFLDHPERRDSVCIEVVKLNARSTLVEAALAKNRTRRAAAIDEALRAELLSIDSRIPELDRRIEDLFVPSHQHRRSELEKLAASGAIKLYASGYYEPWKMQHKDVESAIRRFEKAGPQVPAEAFELMRDKTALEEQRDRIINNLSSFQERRNGQ